MARPIHRRIIQSIPEYSSFHTDGIPSGEEVILSTDEFEVIRLIDKNQMTQEEAAKEMGVSRATIAAIYQKAREKVSLLIVDGRSLSIKGGEYILKETHKESKAYNEIKEKGDYLHSRLCELQNRFPEIVSGARGLGLIQGLVLKDISPAEVIRECESNGLILLRAGTDVLRLVPPLVITKNEIDEGVGIIAKVLSVIA